MTLTRRRVWTAQGNSGCSDNYGSFDAFIPGMRGFGTCNRGGFVPNTNVIVVTNTNASGTGSLNAAINAGCPKVILFGVAGRITLTDGDVNNCDNWSIVGASAPGNVSVTGATGPQILARGDNTTIDNMIFAPQDASGTQGATGNRDAFDLKRGDPADNTLLMNNAFLWGTDEVATCYNAQPDTSTNITFWQNVIGPGLEPSHNYNMLLAGTCDDISLIRNLFVHADYRNPESRSDNVTMSNNIIHNRGLATFSGTPCNSPGANVPKATDSNIVGNIDIRGPQRRGNDAIVAYTFPDGQCFSHQAHVNNNAYETGSTGAIQNCGLNQCTSGSISFNGGGYRSSVIAEAWPTGYVRETLPTTAAGIETFGKTILEHVGPRPNDRLAYVATLVGEAENGLDQTGSLGSWPTGMASEGGISAITPASTSYDPTDGSNNPCGEDMPTGATADAIQSSGLTRLHEWVIGCFYDNVMPAGYREDGLQNYAAPGSAGGPPPPPPPPSPQPKPNPPTI